MKTGWDDWVQNNGTRYKKICLMNKESNVKAVTDALRGNQNPDATEIIKELYLAEDKREQGIGEVEEMIKLIQEQNPDLANEVSEAIKQFACPPLLNGMPPEQVWQFLKSSHPDLTLEQIKNLKCGKYI